jgi:predicted RND superfamily exporter protein
MKFSLLALIFSLLFVSISHAGSDDRDQELPLNSLNTEQNIDEDAAPRFLQEDEEVVQDEEIEQGQKEIEQGQKEIEELIQTKLVNQEISTNSSAEIEPDQDLASTGKIQELINRYIKSDQGILIMIFLFLVALVLVFNFFVREK